MTVVPPSATLREAARTSRRILLTGPIDPDGDSIGACLALARGLRAITTAVVEVAGTPSYRYAWLPDAETMVEDPRVAGPYDLAIVLDGDRRRLVPNVSVAYEAAGARGLIDHHASTDPQDYDLVYLDRRASSTCEMVWHLLESWGHPLDRELATLLYAGVIFDTGGFRHSNTRPSTHLLAARLVETGLDQATINARVLMERRPSGMRLAGHVLSGASFYADGRTVLGAVRLADLARLGASSADLEGIVDLLVFTVGVEVACLAIEKPGDQVKLSLRSRTDADVAALARRIAPGGGGHPRAAGVLIPQPLDDVLAALPAHLVGAVA